MSRLTVLGPARAAPLVSSAKNCYCTPSARKLRLELVFPYEKISIGRPELGE